ncbi:MAG: type II secretion system GspH family protein [Lachnospiraceae bacterium]|nr:type II secretion system GspH family protein [Lachnospiraceae bacterium]
MRHRLPASDRTARSCAGFSLLELIIAVSVLVMMTGALSPALVRYIEKGRERRDTQNIEMVYSAVSGALYDEIAYDALRSGLSENGVYSAPIAVSTLFLQEDAFSEAVKDYIPTPPRLISREARGKNDSNEIMVSVRERVDDATGIRELQTAVWAGDGGHCVDKGYVSGILPETVKTDTGADTETEEFLEEDV